MKAWSAALLLGLAVAAAPAAARLPDPGCVAWECPDILGQDILVRDPAAGGVACLPVRKARRCEAGLLPAAWPGLQPVCAGAEVEPRHC